MVQRTIIISLSKKVLLLDLEEQYRHNRTQSYDSRSHDRDGWLRHWATVVKLNSTDMKSGEVVNKRCVRLLERLVFDAS